MHENCENVDATDEQYRTYEGLCSLVDNLQIAQNDQDGGAIVFEGDGADGPALGYIETDGTVSWIVGE